MRKFLKNRKNLLILIVILNLILFVINISAVFISIYNFKENKDINSMSLYFDKTEYYPNIKNDMSKYETNISIPYLIYNCKNYNNKNIIINGVFGIIGNKGYIYATYEDYKNKFINMAVEIDLIYNNININDAEFYDGHYLNLIGTFSVLKDSERGHIEKIECFSECRKIYRNEKSTSVYIGEHMENALEITMTELFEKPEEYNNKLIKISGIVDMEFEGTKLYISKESYDYMINQNAVYIDVDNGICITSDLYDDIYNFLQQANGKEAIIEGVFLYESNSMYAGVIDKISYFEYKNEG